MAANTFERHVSLLQKLCRICGNLLQKDTFNVSNYSSMIQTAFFVYTDLTNVHPAKICLKCYATMLNIQKRETTTQTKVVTWQPHTSTDCETCAYASGFSKAGRKPKKGKSGRPKSTSNNIWTRKIINGIAANLPPKVLPDNLSVTDFRRNYNPHLHLRICISCKGLLNQPIMMHTCEHTFCATCLFPILEGKSENETVCPICSVAIKFDTLLPLNIMQQMVSSLKVECIKKCGALFSPCKYQEKATHDINCLGPAEIDKSSSPTTLADIFSLKETSIISRDIEDATLHVIKQKMAQSTLPNQIKK